MIFSLKIWGHDLLLEDVENSVTAGFVAEDMELDFTGCKALNPPPETILDIGANIGGYCIPMAKQYPNAKIMAVEPLENNLKCLEANLERNGCNHILTRKLAVSNKKGTMTINQHPINSGSASLFNTHEYKQHICHTVSMDYLVSRALVAFKTDKIDLVKMDIEGAEYLALPAFTEWDKIKKLTIELHGLPVPPEQLKAVEDRTIELIISKLGAENVCFTTTYGGMFLWGEKKERPLSQREIILSLQKESPEGISAEHPPTPGA